MVTHYDEKGKVFTQVVNKEPLQVTIQTDQQMIRGTIYVRPGIRLIDNLIGQEQFVAVTDVVLLNSQNEEIFRSNFLAINVDHIIWVIPNEEMIR